ncbi:transmembrane protease serine 9-like [Frankliniella occidentalis]|uniref:Transmembrane protease serine 9-like n=1 Tax=Frankliniella occidentalis TaxID=133901 RepID=A0A6J1RW34_FRAOC|nr:transmembrane protease serine 9-like [Frankliniella occidentalis]
MRRRKRARREDSGGSEDSEEDEDKDWEPRSPLRPPPVRSLVVGGAEASPGQFPYQAGLLVTRGERGSEGVARCGAALLTDRWLITAAHCCRKGTNIRVFLGSYPTMQDAQQQFDTSVVLMHPKYTRDNPGHHDLALIKLPKPVRFNSKVRPVRLPAWRHRGDDFAGKVATLSGWGKTSDADQRPSKGTAVLHFAKERVLTSEQAESILERKMAPYFLCVRGLQGEVSCNGDSGGPLTVEADDGRPMLIGVVSHRYGQQCDRSRAHVCTRVTSFLPWIASVTRAAIEH